MLTAEVHLRITLWHAVGGADVCVVRQRTPATDILNFHLGGPVILNIDIQPIILTHAESAAILPNPTLIVLCILFRGFILLI